MPRKLKQILFKCKTI